MNKLIGYLSALAITFAIMYAIGFIIALIIALVVTLIVYIRNKLKKPREYTKWEFDSECIPKVTTLENGEKVFQHVTKMCRFNNYRQKWEFETFTDPVKRPFSEAKTINDTVFLSYPFYY